MRSPRLRDADGTEYDPETGERVAFPGEMPVTDEPQDELVAETVAWLNAMAAARYEPVDIPEDAWEDLRVPSDEGSDG